MFDIWRQLDERGIGMATICYEEMSRLRRYGGTLIKPLYLKFFAGQFQITFVFFQVPI